MAKNAGVVSVGRRVRKLARRVLAGLKELITVSSRLNAPTRKGPFKRKPTGTLRRNLGVTRRLKFGAIGLSGCYNCTRVNRNSRVINVTKRLSVMPMNKS